MKLKNVSEEDRKWDQIIKLVRAFLGKDSNGEDIYDRESWNAEKSVLIWYTDYLLKKEEKTGLKLKEILE